MPAVSGNAETGDSAGFATKSAHGMGSCPISGKTRPGIVSAHGRCHGVANLPAHGGSLFPASIGGIAARPGGEPVSA